MTVNYSVTFEFMERPPVTHRGTVTASYVHTCVARATKEATAALQYRSWSSMVCVLLERLDTSPDETQADDRALLDAVLEEARPEVEV